MAQVESPAGFSPHEASGFVERVGPFYRRSGPDGAVFAFHPAPCHLDGAAPAALHAGLMMAFLEIVMADVAREAAGSAVQALSLNCNFVPGAAASPELVEGRASVVRRTRTVLFMEGEASTAGAAGAASDTLLTASGLWRIA